MQKRTIIRTVLDMLFNNAFVKTIASIVNFCNEQRYFYSNKLKFLKNMPLNKVELNRTSQEFLFKVNK